MSQDYGMYNNYCNYINSFINIDIHLWEFKSNLYY